MRTSRISLFIAVLVVAAGVAWYWTSRQSSVLGPTIAVYYTKDDGKTEVPWTVSMRPRASGETASEHLHNAVIYAATQAVAGPPSGVAAVRFPAGTHVLAADVDGSTATIDLSPDVKNETSSTLGESGEFKSLVWTLTGLPGIDRVAVRVQGQQLNTLPGGHLELDQPLRRSDW